MTARTKSKPSYHRWADRTLIPGSEASVRRRPLGPVEFVTIPHSGVWDYSDIAEFGESAQRHLAWFWWFSSTNATVFMAKIGPAKFEQLKNKIRLFRHLQEGWDSYGAGAPGEVAVTAALAVVDELENRDIQPEWVVPTSDATILMQFRTTGSLHKWEFHSDGDIAVMIKPLFDPPTYCDLQEDGIPAFFEKHIDE